MLSADLRHAFCLIFSFLPAFIEMMGLRFFSDSLFHHFPQRLIRNLLFQQRFQGNAIVILKASLQKSIRCQTYSVARITKFVTDRTDKPNLSDQSGNLIIPARAHCPAVDHKVSVRRTSLRSAAGSVPPIPSGNTCQARSASFQ